MKTDGIKRAVGEVAANVRDRGIKAIDVSRDKMNAKRKKSALEVIKEGLVIIYKDENQYHKIRLLLSEANLIQDNGLISFAHCEAPTVSRILKVGNGVDGIDVHVGEDQWVDFIRSFVTLDLIINN